MIARQQIGRDRDLYSVFAAAQSAGSRHVADYLKTLDENRG